MSLLLTQQDVCTSYSTKDSQSFYNYYNNVSKRVKQREVDILLVVNMFLTGFDSKPLNTLYVDKNLRHHGLIQAYSRTNRILNEQKSHGNIVAFRNLKKSTDEAIALFSNKDAKEIILMQPYENYLSDFDEALVKMLEIAPTVDSVNDLETEVEELMFVRAFREMIRIKNTLSTFSDFSFDDLEMSEQEFEDYKSKYLDIYDKTRTHNTTEKDSILDDVDFELELIHKDEINVSYILQLLNQLVGANKDVIAKKKKQISDIISGDARLRSKKELIEQFIEDNLIHLGEEDNVDEAFETYLDEQKKKAFKTICTDEGVEEEKLQKIIENIYSLIKTLKEMMWLVH